MCECENAMWGVSIGKASKVIHNGARRRYRICKARLEDLP